MAETARHEVDSEQVKKATKALLAYQKTKGRSNALLLNEHDRISVLLTVWKIPNQTRAIKIPLPHGIRPDTYDVCLFTKDEPNMSVEQTEKLYKKLLSQHGITQITEIIPLKKMKKEFKQFEAKRRLLSSYDLFLADARIRRLLPSHIGKHFYKEKREPLSVNLKSKNLSRELRRLIQGTQLHVTNRGCCYAIRVGHTGMKVEDIVENVLAVAKVLAEKLPMKWKNVKVLHLKTQSSVALPIYNSSFDSLKDLSLVKVKQVKTKKRSIKSAREHEPVTPISKKTGDVIADGKNDAATPHKEPNEADDAEEEIPQLVPIQKPSSATKSKIKKTDSLEESKVEEKSKASEENVQASSTKSSTLKKRKINGSEDFKTPSKHKKEMPSEEKKENPEEQETPANRSILKRTPRTQKKGLSSDEKSKEPEEQETLAKGRVLRKTPRKRNEVLPSQEKSREPEEQDTPKRSVLKKTPSKHKKELPSEEESKEPGEQKTPAKPSVVKKTPSKRKKMLVSEEASKEPEEQETLAKGRVLRKTPSKRNEVLPSEEKSREPEEQHVPKRSVVKKTPSKHKKELLSEEESKEPEEQETPPKRSIITKTPKKTPRKAAVKLTKSARKAPQTPKLKQKKKMKTPESV
ncbi:ribosomal L1 domain-containing protein 1 [Bufo gargarizans]|uniref:ribosomal L1 domain-containing protein 1 n=1 Tax=Bufo gargarizans TaxID=30331 RepID=UPI001CF16E93|nr:ribosomal L1 domain-containing protein 1 [Bufo gargarizans]